MPETRDRNWWVSWYLTEELGPFELHSPWWVSGERCSDGAQTIVAAVKAASERDAKAIVLSSFDTMPTALNFEWRFCENKPGDWSPYSERFPQAKWMCWNA